MSQSPVDVFCELIRRVLAYDLLEPSKDRKVVTALEYLLRSSGMHIKPIDELIRHSVIDIDVQVAKNANPRIRQDGSRSMQHGDVLGEAVMDNLPQHRA